MPRLLALLVVLHGTLAQARPAASPAEWQRVKQALLARPTASYAEIGRALRLSPAAVTKLIDQHASRKEIWEARDLETARRVAAIARRAPEDARGNLRSLARLLQDELPGLADHNLAKLARRHPDLLSGLAAPRAISKPVPKPARERIAKLALAHPTLDYKALAQLFEKDAVLKDVLPWSEAEVSRLREPSRILPSDARRSAALAKAATACFAALPAGTRFEQALTTLRREHPGAARETLVKLAHNDPALATQLRRLDGVGAPATKARAGRSGASAVAPASIDLALARKLDPGRLVIERALEAGSAGLVARFKRELATLEAERGNNDGKLAPSDLAGAAPELVAVMAKVYRKTRKQTLPLAQIDAALPAAIAAAAHAGKRAAPLAGLYQRAIEETMKSLAARYREEVVGGSTTASGFPVAHGMTHATFGKLQKGLPDAFPKVGELALEGARLEGVARLYRELVAGRITTGAFYSRAKVSADQLRILQATDPERFPRPEGTPSWRTVSGRREADLSESAIATLSRAWKAEVATGQKGIKSFEREHGLGHRLEQLRSEHPEQFPAPAKQKRPTRDDAGRDAMAREVGAKASALFAKDVLLTQADLIAALNRDADLVARCGKLTLARYQQLFTRKPSAFPQLADRDLILDALADEIRALKRSDGSLTPRQLTEKLQARHPRFKLSRVYQLRERFPGLIDEAGVAAVPAAQRRQDAERLAQLLQAGGARKGAIAAIAATLKREDARFSKDYLYRLRREFEADYFASGAAARRPPSTERSSLPVQELYALLVRLAPPGTGDRTLAAALDRLLAARGLPTYGGAKVPVNIARPAGQRYGSIEAQSARVTSEIVAEYAAAAPRGTAQQVILEKVLADYPSIDRQKLTTYVNLWTRSPRSYPALAPYLSSRGALSLEGKGSRPASPRYLGGWDPGRALLGAGGDTKLAAELARASQYARIPQHLPLLDLMVKDLKGSTPLRGKNVLWVSHLLATTVPLANALKAAGTLAKSTIVVGTPYGSNPAVRETLAEQGFDVRVPALSMSEYRRAVERALDDMVARYRQNQKPIVVLDDGGLVSEILRSNRKYANVIGAFKIVEQTTRGITVAEQGQLKLPVVNVARSLSKRAEGKFIGRAVAQKTVQGLRGLGRRLEGARATVVGYGVIGQAIAKELRERGATVTVVETSLERAAQARRAGFKVAEKARALASAEVVIGATGTRSLSLEDLRLLPSGAIVASASSKQVELDMEGLAGASRSRTLVAPASPLVRLPTARYQLGRAQLTVLGDGWPVNFDGDVEDIPANLIQITRALMFAGAIQASGIKAQYTRNQGLTPLDPKVDKQILRRFTSLSRGRADWAAHDPTRWTEVVREVATALR